MLAGGTISSETNLQSEIEQSLLIFRELSHFILRCLAMLSVAYPTATDNVKGPQKYQKVPFVTIVLHWRATLCFYFCSFSYQATMKSKFSDNW